MLRTTIPNEPGTLTFQLEGRLAGRWVRVLQECWLDALGRQRQPILRVDLTGVASIDTAGRDQLAAMYREGAEFVAADCLTKAVVAEMTGSPTSNAAEGGGTDGGGD
jgi:ABC-type transporter Mla MlaB component